MKQPRLEVPANAPLDVDTSLPPAKRSKLAADMHRWCVSGSWMMCQTCGSMQPRDMKPCSFDVDPSPYISKSHCWRCSAKRDYQVPLPSDAPEELHGLTLDICNALSPLAVCFFSKDTPMAMNPLNQPFSGGPPESTQKLSRLSFICCSRGGRLGTCRCRVAL